MELAAKSGGEDNGATYPIGFVTSKYINVRTE
jgi:hypothetical protein